MLFGSDTVFKPLQPLNKSNSKVDTLSGITISVNDVQSLKVPCPNDVTVFGIDMCFKLLQFENTPLYTSSTPG